MSSQARVARSVQRKETFLPSRRPLLPSRRLPAIDRKLRGLWSRRHAMSYSDRRDNTAWWPALEEGHAEVNSSTEVANITATFTKP